MQQAILERLLQLIHLMSGPRYYSLEELHDILGITVRSLFRYRDTFIEAGLPVEKVQYRAGCYRIAPSRGVQILNEAWSLHEYLSDKIDVFRMGGEDRYHVRLELSSRARNLLLDEYPLSERCIEEEGDKYIFDSWVYALEGVGRFVIGLAGDITILEGEELREHIRSYVSSHLCNI